MHHIVQDVQDAILQKSCRDAKSCVGTKTLLVRSYSLS
jgi:hypothetical protein